ncbi:hypothetical protein CDO44_00795 [Pigmentiphaga sp. NML080357]|nr:hypothetical protein CDO44_00795 [Pigmentiphaga sp. NML080357]
MRQPNPWPTFAEDAMTPHERTLLEDFLNKLAGVQGVDKDAEADALIRQQAARQPDALYLTIQRALLLEHALADAKARIAELQQKIDDLEARPPAKSSGSFLGGLLGGDAWGRSSRREEASSGPLIGSRLGQRAGLPVGNPGAPQSYAQSPAAGGMGSFLGNAAATAAGVAGGMFLFNGIEHLLGGGANAAAQAAGNAPVSETITENITNNYGTDAGQDGTGDLQADASQDGDGWLDEGDSFGDDDFV